MLGSLPLKLVSLESEKTNNRRDRRKREQMNTHLAHNRNVENKINLDTEGYRQRVTFNCQSVVLATSVINKQGVCGWIPAECRPQSAAVRRWPACLER